jgi:hypothetical protein
MTVKNSFIAVSLIAASITAHAENYFGNAPSFSMPNRIAPQKAQSSASPEQERMHECAMEGLVFSMAASFRDSKWPPQYAFDYLHKAKYDGINDSFLKKAINLVYFDGNFSGAGGSALSQQITEECIKPTNWKPLK